MKTTAAHYFENQLLIAMPNLHRSHFSQTVSYLCQHDEEGALAVVINRQTKITLGDIFEKMGIDTANQQAKDTPVFAGGPVRQERVFVIHNSSNQTWDASISVSNKTALTVSPDILEAIANHKGPNEYLIAMGYAGWQAGQLEQEIIDNTWLTTPYKPDILYHTPAAKRWDLAAAHIGVDINQLTTDAGHG